MRKFFIADNLLAAQPGLEPGKAAPNAAVLPITLPGSKITYSRSKKHSRDEYKINGVVH